MQTLLAATATVPGWQPLPRSATASLLAPHFFAGAIGAAFHGALVEAFLFAGTIMAVGPLVSAIRGERLVHDESAPASAPAPPASEGGTAGGPSSIVAHR